MNSYGVCTEKPVGLGEDSRVSKTPSQGGYNAPSSECVCTLIDRQSWKAYESVWRLR